MKEKEKTCEAERDGRTKKIAGERWGERKKKWR